MSEKLKYQDDASWGKPEPIGTSAAVGSPEYKYKHEASILLEFDYGNSTAVINELSNLPGIISVDLFFSCDKVGVNKYKNKPLLKVNFGADNDSDYSNSFFAIDSVSGASIRSLQKTLMEDVTSNRIGNLKVEAKHADNIPDSLRQFIEKL